MPDAAFGHVPPVGNVQKFLHAAHGRRTLVGEPAEQGELHVAAAVGAYRGPRGEGRDALGEVHGHGRVETFQHRYGEPEGLAQDPEVVHADVRIAVAEGNRGRQHRVHPVPARNHECRRTGP